MLPFLEARSPREKWLMGLMAAVLLATAAEKFGWQPLHEARLRAQAAAQQSLDDAAWLSRATPEQLALPTGQVEANLQTLINQTTTQQGLVLHALSLQGNDRAEASFRMASFSMLMGWLHQLEQQHHVRIESLQVSRSPENTVDAVIVLSR